MLLIFLVIIISILILIKDHKNNAEIKYIEMPDNLKGQYQEYTCADTAKLNSVTDIKFTTVKDFVNG